MNMEPVTISITGAAKALGLGRTSIYELIKSGRLETVKFGRRNLIKTASIRRLIDAQD
jgi:excisionase family DNA binding protein